MSSALYTQGRSSHMPIPTLRFSCYELGPLLRTSTRPTLNLPPPPPHVCLSIHPEGTQNLLRARPISDRVRVLTDYADFQGTSNGGRQFWRNRWSNRHIVPLYGKSECVFTQGCKFAHC